jgi:TonB family protein
MDAKRFLLWLGVSVVFHLALVAILPLIRLQVKQVDAVVRVGFLPDMPGAHVAKPKPILPELPQIVRQSMPRQAQQGKINRIGGQTAVPGAPGTADPGSRIPNRPIGAPGPGRSNTPTPAPATPTSPGGNIQVPMNSTPTDSGSGAGHGKDPQGGYSGGGETQAAGVVSRRSVTYPKNAITFKRNGEVTLSVAVSSSGHVIGTPIVTSSTGGDDFVASAIASVKRWTFSQAIRDGVAVDSSISVTVIFENGVVKFR